MTEFLWQHLLIQYHVWYCICTGIFASAVLMFAIGACVIIFYWLCKRRHCQVTSQGIILYTYYPLHLSNVFIVHILCFQLCMVNQGQSLRVSCRQTLRWNSVLLMEWLRNKHRLYFMSCIYMYCSTIIITTSSYTFVHMYTTVCADIKATVT